MIGVFYNCTNGAQPCVEQWYKEQFLAIFSFSVLVEVRTLVLRVMILVFNCTTGAQPCVDQCYKEQFLAIFSFSVPVEGSEQLILGL